MDLSEEMKDEVPDAGANKGEASADRAQHENNRADDLPHHEPDRARDGVDDRQHGAFDPRPDALEERAAPEPRLFPAFGGLFPLALALEPTFVPDAVLLDRRSLQLKPTLMLAQILLRGGEHFAGFRNGLFRNGDGRLELGDGLGCVSLLSRRRPDTLFTHRTDHVPRLR